MSARFTPKETTILLQAAFLLQREAGLVTPAGDATPHAAVLSWQFPQTSLAAGICTSAAIDPDWRPT